MDRRGAAGSGAATGSGSGGLSLGIGTSALPTLKKSARPKRLGLCQELSEVSASDQISLTSRSRTEAPFNWAWKPISLPCAGADFGPILTAPSKPQPSLVLKTFALNGYRSKLFPETWTFERSALSMSPGLTRYWTMSREYFLA